MQAIDWDNRMRTVKWIDVNGRTTNREGVRKQRRKFVEKEQRRKKFMKQKQNQQIQRLKILPGRCHSGLVRKWIMPFVNVL